MDGLLVNAAPALTPHMYSRDAVSAQTCPNSLFHFRPQGGWPTESTFLQDHQRVATASMVVQQHDPIMIDVMISGGLPIQSALIPKDVLSAQRHSSGTPSSSAPPAWYGGYAQNPELPPYPQQAPVELPKGLHHQQELFEDWRNSQQQVNLPGNQGMYTYEVRTASSAPRIHSPPAQVNVSRQHHRESVIALNNLFKAPIVPVATAAIKRATIREWLDRDISTMQPSAIQVL